MNKQDPFLMILTAEGDKHATCILGLGTPGFHSSPDPNSSHGPGSSPDSGTVPYLYQLCICMCLCVCEWVWVCSEVGIGMQTPCYFHQVRSDVYQNSSFINVYSLGVSWNVWSSLGSYSYSFMLELPAYGNSHISTWWFLRVECISWTNCMHFRCALCEACWVLFVSKVQRSQGKQTY